MALIWGEFSSLLSSPIGSFSFYFLSVYKSRLGMGLQFYVTASPIAPSALRGEPSTLSRRGEIRIRKNKGIHSTNGKVTFNAERILWNWNAKNSARTLNKIEKRIKYCSLKKLNSMMRLT